MKFISTRGQAEAVSFTEAVATGLAPDGGLYLPDALPDISERVMEWGELAYPELCGKFLRLFATDIPARTLDAIVRRSYANFAHPEIAPLRKLDASTYVLELFHGPTLAFKDFALQLLGNLYQWQCEKSGGHINVLGATSGDTGAAAIHGLLGKPRAGVFILYPDGRVSPLQERQMACTGEENVHAIAIDGTFDDAQRVLKEAFGDHTFARQQSLSAINSINIARVLAQCVYYLHAWMKLEPGDRARLEFVVPTGNFGNVLAGWLLSRMGVPLTHFRVATNQNDILHRFFETGVYRVDKVLPSHAPSMDIQVASNFERFLFYALDGDPVRVTAAMEQLKTTGEWTFADFKSAEFSSSRADDKDIVRIIRDVQKRFDYIVDPHTACAFQKLHPDRVSVVLATAHPAKFPDVIKEATGTEATHPSLEALKDRPLVKHRLKADVEEIKAFIAKRGVQR